MSDPSETKGIKPPERIFATKVQNTIGIICSLDKQFDDDIEFVPKDIVDDKAEKQALKHLSDYRKLASRCVEQKENIRQDATKNIRAVIFKYKIAFENALKCPSMILSSRRTEKAKELMQILEIARKELFNEIN